MRLEKGDVIKTTLSDNTMVLDARDNQAILFTGNQFVIAPDIKFNGEKGIAEWDNGKYAFDFKDIANMMNNDFETMKDTLTFLKESNHKDFVKSLISIETGEENLEKLDNAYDNYMNDLVMGLANDNFYNYTKDNDDFESIKETLSSIINNHTEDFTKAMISIEKGINDIDSLDIIYNDYMENDSMMLLNDEFDYMIDELREDGKIKDVAEETIEKESNDLVNIVGNILKDPEILDIKKDNEFKVSNFTIVSKDKEGNKIYTNCSAYGDKMEIPKNFKQGDFVKIFGQVKTSIDDIGKEYTNVRVLSSKLLKTKEHMKDSSKTKDKSEKEKQSIIGQIKKHQEEAKEKPTVKKENKIGNER